MVNPELTVGRDMQRVKLIVRSTFKGTDWLSQNLICFNATTRSTGKTYWDYEYRKKRVVFYFSSWLYLGPAFVL